MSTEHARKLLIVDDDGGVVDFLCESLAARGFTVTACGGSSEALARVRAESFDLVITDVEMPDMRGTDLCAAILADKPDQLVLLITAFGSIELALAAVRGGACDFVPKPFKIEALVFAIERAFRDRQMRREIVRLKQSDAHADTGELIAKSPVMQKVMDIARRAAGTDSTVLLTGETGTGKGAIARFIHDAGARRAAPFIHLNCASLPETLVESELFGVRRGAFTDARTDRSGAFVAAGDGTLFLDEIGEVPLEVQAKLLHALENGRVRPLGGTSEIPIPARMIAATNQSLEGLLRHNRFRPDLYYRLNVIRIEIPPLRERRDDIIPLADLFLARFSARSGRRMIGTSAAAIRRLVAYRWPGNVRELANLLERAIALSDHDTLIPEDLDLPDSGVGGFLTEIDGNHAPLEDVERAYVQRVLAARGGNKSEAARALGIDRRTLYRKLHGVR